MIFQPHVQVQRILRRPFQEIFRASSHRRHLLRHRRATTICSTIIPTRPIEAEKTFVEESLAKLRQVPAGDLNPDEAIDYALLEGKLTIQSYEHAKEDYRLKWPDTYSPDRRDLYSHRAGDQRPCRQSTQPSQIERRQLIRQGIANLSRDRRQPAETVDGKWRSKAPRGRQIFWTTCPTTQKFKAAVKDTAASASGDPKRQQSAHRVIAQFLETRFAAAQPRRLRRGRRALQSAPQRKNIFSITTPQSLLALGEALFAKTKTRT